MEEIKGQLKSIVLDLYGLEVDPEVTVAPEDQRDAKKRKIDYATNIAMRLAGQLKRAPREIAGEVAEKVKNFDVEVAGPGFLNFVMSDDYFKKNLEDLAGDFEGFVARKDFLGQVVVSEFSDPNPFKVLHVGHLYTSIVGEAISRMVEFAGGEVKRANFGGDVGLHVAKTLYAVMKSGITLESEEPAKVAEALAKCYVEGTRAYEDDEEAHDEIVKINKQIYEIAESNLHDSELARLYWRGREASYDYFKEFYASIGLSFDKYYPESTVARRGLEVVQEQLKNGVYEDSDGAVVFKGEPYGLHTRVFINKEGLPTYEAKDVGLIHQKWDDYHFDKSLVITGNDIIDYMKVVLKSVEQYNPKLVERTTHLTHGNVRLAGNEKMSSRKGNFLRAVDVLEMVRKALEDERGEQPKSVSMAAVKYAFLKYKVGGDIIFDVKDSVSMTGNSGPYLQYAAVRARKILVSVGGLNTFSEDRVRQICRHGLGGANARLARLRTSPEKDSAQPADDWVLSEYERELIKKILQYKDVLREAVEELAPHKICAYLYELAQTFNRFYENVKVVGSEYETERGVVVSAYLAVLTHGLGLLGIEVPEEM